VSFSPDRSCPSSEKESLVGDESDSGDEHLRNEQMLPPPLTGRGGAPRTILDSSGTLAFGLPPDHAIRQEVMFETPPAILKEKAEVAAAEPKHNDGNNTDTQFTDRTIIYVAGSVLESTFGDQARAGDVLTEIILHRRQQRSSVEGRQHQQETPNLMDHQADTTLVSRTTHSGTPFSPHRRDDVSLARLKNVEQNDDSLASGSLYHHRDDNDVDDDEGSADVNFAPGDSSSITSVVSRRRGRGGGRGRGRGGGRGRGRGRG
jgi:hypothetical protein